MFEFRHSIFFKIIVLFFSALLSFFAISYYFIQDHIANENLLSEARYKQFVDTINEIMNTNADMHIIQQYLHAMQFSLVESPEIKESLPSIQKPPGFTGVFATMYNAQDGIYILLETSQKQILYKENVGKTYGDFYVIMFMGIVVLTFVFFLVLKSLMPIKSLKGHIKQIADGKFVADIKSFNEKDEVGQLYNEFYKAANRIKSLNESRTLLLRSIMHELKTPITKGRIIAEMINDQKYQKQLTSAFMRLNDLINEFAKLEQITSKNYSVNKQEFLLIDLIKHTKDMLLIDRESNDTISLSNGNSLIKADFDLFAIAIKNLLDNAIKYSYDGKVSVYVKHHKLYISNNAPALQHEFKEYFKPYFKNKSQLLNKGFGLGMYIIKNTLDTQGFGLSYKHKDGVNTFIIEGCVVENYCLINESSKSKGEKNV